LKLYEKAFAILATLPRTPALERELVAHHLAIGNLQRQLGNLEAASKSCAEAYRLLLALSPQDPNRRTTVAGAPGTAPTAVRMHDSADIDISRLFFSVLNDQGNVHRDAGEPDLALMKYNEALYIQQRLVRDNPKHEQIALFRHGLAGQWSRLGDLM